MAYFFWSAPLTGAPRIYLVRRGVGACPTSPLLVPAHQDLTMHAAAEGEPAPRLAVNSKISGAQTHLFDRTRGFSDTGLREP